MILVRWSDIGHAQEPGEWHFTGLSISVSRENIAHWEQDPDGVWEVDIANKGAMGLDRRYQLTRWHPSGMA